MTLKVMNIFLKEIVCLKKITHLEKKIKDQPATILKNKSNEDRNKYNLLVPIFH